MILPLLSFTVGLALLFFGVALYLGFPSSITSSFRLNLKGNLFSLWGSILISLAAMLGVVGYYNVFRGDDLRLGRIFLLILGVAASTLAIVESWDDDHPFKKLGIKNRLKKQRLLKFIYYGLTAIAAITLFTIFLIAFNDYNYGGDAFMYHIPFAARIWGIIPLEQYEFEYVTENRLLGFPLLANWLQGLFWVIFRRIEATNLVAYTSLIILIVYLVRVPKIPFYLSTLAMLAIPMVHMHAARSLIDLPGNIAISIIIITLYLLYIDKLSLNVKSILILFLSALAAANIKLQLIPIVFLLMLTAIPLFFRRYWRADRERKQNLSQLAKISGIGILASLLIFYTPIKNIVLYQNPFYPVKISIAGHALNHTESSPEFMHPNIRKLLPPLRWGRSVLEINAFDNRRPWPWTLGMDFISWDEERFGMGGYFGAYVIFNLALLGVLVWQFWSKETQAALIVIGLMTAVTVWMPQSYELRYYMYWMIVLVSLNAYLVCRFSEERHPSRNPLKPEYFGLVALVFMLIFMKKTNNFFTLPAFQDVNQQLTTTDWLVRPKIFNQIQDGDRVCIVGQAPNTFFYNSYFHQGRSYSVIAEFLEDERMKNRCQGLKILR
jgi:hypothetical protein